jgi:hypothetical protein
MATQFGGKRERDEDEGYKEPPAKDRHSEAKKKAQEELDRKREKGQRVADIVACSIRHPSHYHRTEGVHLWGNRYRVNVWTAVLESEYGIEKRTIHQSYFIMSDGETILQSIPELS